MRGVKLVAAVVGALSLAALVCSGLLPRGAWAPGQASIEAVAAPPAVRRIEVEPPRISWGRTPARVAARRAAPDALGVERYVEERDALSRRLR